MLEPDVVTPASDVDLAKPLARAGQVAGAAAPWSKHKVKAALFGEPPRPLRVGPYEIHGELGRGGMGLVLDGFDPRLGRRVAVKLLSPSLGRDGAATLRLLREAQAMARLSHPHVVQVYESGTTDDGHVFVAMERVEGQTLLQWQRAAPRSWQACLDKYLQAGEGLAAAHAEGLVHRDFKPTNCMIDAEGRVRVLDFGLAKTLDDASEPQGSAASGPSHDTARQRAGLTRSGALVGTLAYMAPEQLEGRPTDPRSDQFSFCVALFEALCGRRPFEGESIVELHDAMLRAPATIRHPRVPRRLLGLVRRGLAFDPAQRWPDLPSLLRALRRYPVARLRLRVGALAAVGVTVGGLALMPEPPPPPCEALSRATLPGWDDARRAAVARAMAESGASYGPTMGRVVEAELDRYAAEWRDAQVSACEQAPAAPEAASAQRACLDRLAGQLGALTEQLAAGAPAVVEQAAFATAGLVPVASCALVDGRSRGPSPAPEQEAAVAAARVMIDRVQAHVLTGQFEAVSALASEAVDAARASGHGPTLVEALLAAGRLDVGRGAAERARGPLLEALRIAERDAADLLVIDALYVLVDVALERSRVEAAEGWLELVEGKLGRVGEPPEARAGLHTAQGRVAYAARRFDDAVAHYEAALELVRARYGAEDLRGIRALDRLANALDGAGRPEDARAAFVEMIGILQAGLDQHPVAARGYHDLAAHDLEVAGDAQAAIEGFSRALEILRDAGITSGARVARAERGLALALRGAGEREAASAHAEAAATAAASLDPSQRVPIEDLRAVLKQDLGDLRGAIESYERAAAILRASEEPDGVELAMLDSNIGECLLLLGDVVAARERFRRALEVLEPRLPPDDPRLAYPLRGMGDVLLAEGQPAAARDVLERALRARAAAPDEQSLAEIQWALARARWQTAPAAERERVRVETRALAQQALATLRRLQPDSERVRAIEAWVR